MQSLCNQRLTLQIGVESMEVILNGCRRLQWQMGLRGTAVCGPYVTHLPQV